MQRLSSSQKDALNNAIASVEMEGYKLTEFHKKLCRNVLNGDISKKQCIDIILERYGV